MEVKLLKKLRKQAYKDYGITYYCGYYYVGLRANIKALDIQSLEFNESLESAKKALCYMRRRNILYNVRKIRDKFREKEVSKIRKELSKL